LLAARLAFDSLATPTRAQSGHLKAIVHSSVTPRVFIFSLYLKNEVAKRNMIA
jgi:hypothetical protein